MTDFVKRIDSILQEKNLKRAALCSELELSSTSITDWARRGTVPAGYRKGSTTRTKQKGVKYIIKVL